MEMLINQLLATILQMFVFNLIPFIWYKASKLNISYRQWLGLKKFNPLSWRVFLVSFGFLLLFVILGFYTLTIIPDTRMLANAKFDNWQLTTIFSLFLYAFFQTALTEELFFRGFLGKLLIAKLGFRKGNLGQALIFGIVHGLLFLKMKLNFFSLFSIILLTGSIGYGLGYINEKLAKGSIIPSWLLHSLANILGTKNSRCIVFSTVVLILGIT